MFYLASTKIAPEKTASEIMAVLAKKGAKQILSEYEDGEIAALSFLIVAQNRELPFRLPVRWDRCLKAMKQDYKTPRNLCTPEQARRTAWRIILKWVQAQFALIDTEMASLTEVMLPYLQTGQTTLYEKLEAAAFNLIPERT